MTIDIPIAGRWAYGSKSSSRLGATIDTLLIHGGAVTSTGGLKSTLEGPRGVSANMGVGADGLIFQHVPISERAFTSGATDDGGRGAAWDRRSVTIEVAQVSATPWRFSQAAEDAVVTIGVAMRKAGMLPVIDRTPERAPVGVIGHRELYEWHRASYPSECPAGWSRTDLDRIAARILAGDTTTLTEEEMALGRIVRIAGNGTRCYLLHSNGILDCDTDQKLAIAKTIVDFKDGDAIPVISLAQYNEWGNHISWGNPAGVFKVLDRHEATLKAIAAKLGVDQA